MAATQELLSLLAIALAASSSAQTICLDPGHPSENGVGSRGKNVTEVEAAWKIALELKQTLLKDGYRVVLTKSRQEQMVTNRERARIANSHGSSLFLRLHCDAGSGSGFGVYWPDRTVTLKGRKGPSKLVISQSRKAARAIHASLAKGLKGVHHDLGLKTDRDTAIGGRQGALTGSIFSNVPVVLIEMGVLTNPKDEAFLASKEGRSRLVQALAKGIEAIIPSPSKGEG